MEISFALECAPTALYNLSCGPNSTFDANVQIMTLDILREETSHKGIASTISVGEFIFRYLLDRKFCNFSIFRNDHWINSLSDYCYPGSILILFRQFANFQCNFFKILGFPVLGGAKYFGLLENKKIYNRFWTLIMYRMNSIIHSLVLRKYNCLREVIINATTLFIGK